MHKAMIDELTAAGTLSNPAVEAAFRRVPRHVFLPSEPSEEVYRDQAIVTKQVDGIGVSSSSQPTIMAVMLEQLDVRPGHRVLEIGAGTGYNAALLADLVGHTGRVTTVDIDAEIVDNAQEHLNAAGFERVQVVCVDGGLGHLAGAPYDWIILTVGAWDITPSWWEQLSVDGRLVLPLALRGPETQRSIGFDRRDDHLVSASVRPCGFMLLRGAFSGPIQQVPLGPAPDLRLVHEHTGRVDAASVFKWLRKPCATRKTGVRANSLAVCGGLNLWLALSDSRFCAVRAEGSDVESRFEPTLYGHGRFRTTVGLVGDRGVSLLSRAQDAPSVTDADEWTTASPPFELEVRSFGDDARVGEDLLKLVRAWDASGAPNEDNLQVRVYPRNVQVVPAQAERVISKRWTQLVLTWT